MALTTKDIIKILPLNEALKSDLLNSFDTLDPDQKYTVEETIWETYDTLFELKLEENLTVAFMNITDQDMLDDTFYQKIRDKTEEEMSSETETVKSTIDLSETRQKLQQIVEQKN